MSFVGKSAVVTGAGSGIGFQTSRNLLLQGVTQLAVIDLKCTEDVLQSLQSASPKASILFQKTDVTKRTDVEKSFATVFQKFGYIDILVNSAGIFDEQNFERIFAVNVFGRINATEVAVDYMSKEKGGHGGIVGTVASTVSLDCIFSQPYYNATKHAILGFFRTLSDKYYYNVWGIKFILVCPGITDTPLIEGIGARLYHKDADKETCKLKAHLALQSPEVCGKHLVEVLHKPNGTIWMLDDSKITEVVLKNHWLPESY